MKELTPALAEIIKSHHNSTSHQQMRWIVNDDRNHGGCYNALGYVLRHGGQTISLIYHGGGVELSDEALFDKDLRNKEMINARQNLLHFKGTERSKEWVQFLVSDESPWHALNDMMMSKDPEWINDNAFVFDTPKVYSRKLLYNFALAERFPWEMPHQFGLWRKLVQTGVSKPEALFIAYNFLPRAEAKDINGPWRVVYPWSFLEGASLECAARFITGNPDLHETDTSVQPNVQPLWSAKNKKKVNYKALMLELDKDTELTLDKVLARIEEVMAEQQIT